MAKFTMGHKRQGKKLSGEQVLNIRELYATGTYTQGQLAREFNVSLTTIAGIVNGTSWKNIAGAQMTDKRMEPLSEEQLVKAEQDFIKLMQEKVDPIGKLNEEFDKMPEALLNRLKGYTG